MRIIPHKRGINALIGGVWQMVTSTETEETQAISAEDQQYLTVLAGITDTSAMLCKVRMSMSQRRHLADCQPLVRPREPPGEWEGPNATRPFGRVSFGLSHSPKEAGEVSAVNDPIHEPQAHGVPAHVRLRLQ